MLHAGKAKLLSMCSLVRKEGEETVEFLLCMGTVAYLLSPTASTVKKEKAISTQGDNAVRKVSGT